MHLARIWPCLRARPRLGADSRASKASSQARRFLSTAPELVRVPVRARGAVTLSIHYPVVRASNQPNPILLYLPPGVGGSRSSDEATVSALQAASQATVVQINYRIGPGEHFPVPVHDVLAGYDWVIANLVPDLEQAPSSTSRRTTPARLGVCGELVGGGLAAMLALTECRLGRHRIVAAAFNNPILDWLFPREIDPFQAAWEEAPPLTAVKRRSQKSAGPSSWETFANHPGLPSSALYDARRASFDKAEHYFDRFASPIHFFRTPTAELVPVTKPDVTPLLTDDASLYPEMGADGIDSDDTHPHDFSLLDHIQQPSTPADQEPIFLHEDALTPLSSPSSSSSSSSSILTPCRTYHRAHPPSSSGLHLPMMRLSTGTTSILHDQAQEFTRLARRSVLRSMRAKAGIMRDEDFWAWDTAYDGHNARGSSNSSGGDNSNNDAMYASALEAKTAALADRKVELVVCEGGVGLWNVGEGEHMEGMMGDSDWKRRRRMVEEAGGWFRRILKY